MRLARAKRIFYFMKRELWLHIGLYLAVGVDVLDDPRSLRSPPHIRLLLKKRGLREPSLVREGGNRTELAECRLTDE